MKSILSGIVLLSFALLMGCSGKESEQEAKTERKALYREVDAPLEKAKAVERQLEENAELQKRQIDDQTDE
jgi:hypothetical protein